MDIMRYNLIALVVIIGLGISTSACIPIRTTIYQPVAKEPLQIGAWRLFVTVSPDYQGYNTVLVESRFIPSQSTRLYPYFTTEMVIDSVWEWSGTDLIPIPEYVLPVRREIHVAPSNSEQTQTFQIDRPDTATWIVRVFNNGSARSYYFNKVAEAVFVKQQPNVLPIRQGNMVSINDLMGGNIQELFRHHQIIEAQKVWFYSTKLKQADSLKLLMSIRVLNPMDSAIEQSQVVAFEFSRSRDWQWAPILPFHGVPFRQNRP